MRHSPAKEFWLRFFSNPRIWFGLVIVLFLTGISILAPWISPTDPEDMDIALRLTPPNADDWLGRDMNGGSVLTA
ncbi:ABC transporter permease, partial [Candidatus Falkowbacteria bacterium CG_4_9_14_3_um_filter_36_9]